MTISDFLSPIIDTFVVIDDYYCNTLDVVHSELLVVSGNVG